MNFEQKAELLRQASPEQLEKAAFFGAGAALRFGGNFLKDTLTSGKAIGKGIAALPGLIANPKNLWTNMKSLYNQGLGMDVAMTLGADVPMLYSSLSEGAEKGIGAVNSQKLPRKSIQATFPVPERYRA